MEDGWGPRQSPAWAGTVGTESSVLLGTMQSHRALDMNPVLSSKALWVSLGCSEQETGSECGGGREALRRLLCRERRGDWTWGGRGEGQGTGLAAEPTGLAYDWVWGRGGP